MEKSVTKKILFRLTEDSNTPHCEVLSVHENNFVICLRFASITCLLTAVLVVRLVFSEGAVLDEIADMGVR